MLAAVTSKDWDTYSSLCDPSLSCFEPEANGHLVEGLDLLISGRIDELLTALGPHFDTMASSLEIVAEGAPEDVALNHASYTGQFVRPYLSISDNTMQTNKAS